MSASSGGANIGTSDGDGAQEPPSHITSNPDDGVNDDHPPISNTTTAVKWADMDQDQDHNHTIKDIEHKAASIGHEVTAGTTKLWGWTVEHSKIETQTAIRKLRPMHVRVAVRVHHVAFLHPGLDNGGRATIGDRNLNKWSRFGKKKKPKRTTTQPPGLLKFGSKQGSWKNPKSQPNPFEQQLAKRRESDNIADDNTFVDNDDNSAEVSEIISAEAFRLSRDGIIQHHYALKNAAPQQPTSSPTTKRRSSPGTSRWSMPGRRTSSPQKYPASSSPIQQQQQNQSNNLHPNMLSQYSSSNPQEAARYYKECAERPKGYRRLVVSSAIPANDVPIPSPPTYNNYDDATAGISSSRNTRKLSENDLSRGGGHESSSSLATMGQGDKTRAQKDDHKEHLFDDVEYQYVGPPQTGPEFFQLLRRHGAANFGTYLPELACNVPDHSIGFELRKSKSKRIGQITSTTRASTQPIVVEAPHIIWGDASDKMLSKIENEGCPLIDSRKFEYVSNADLDDTELSESLMVCGATLWVQNAEEGEGDTSSTSALKPQYTKALVKTEYYGGKFIDGVETGMKGIGKGVTKTVLAAGEATGAAKAVEKGTKELGKVVEEGTKRLASPHHGEVVETCCSHSAQSKEHKPKKKSKVKALFSSPKRRSFPFGRKKGHHDGEHSVDESAISSVGGHDDGEESIDTLDTKPVPVPDTLDGAAVQQPKLVDEDAHMEGSTVPTDKPTKEEEKKEQEEEEFTVVKPVPYVLLLDDIIDIRIASFPDRDNVIASFPISVASIMVQRSMDDRTNDPLKPSELTATFIQEPCAHRLQWGVELKVTLRAVEVKPDIPRVVTRRPKDVINEEMENIKDKLLSLGKKPEDVQKTLYENKEQLMKEENDLNGAIIQYGYGKGEDEGAGPQEIRLRQMFYSDRECMTIKRKLKKRRGDLNDAEKKLLEDTTIDPSAKAKTKKGAYSEEEKQKLIEILNINFPGIDKEEPLITEEIPDITTAESSESETSIIDGSPLAKLSISMAKSFDVCLGELTKQSTMPKVQQKLRSTFTEGMENPITSSDAKKWCSEVAQKLSTLVRRHSTSDIVGIRSKVTEIQSIIHDSAPGSSMSISFEDEDDEEVDQKDIELSQTNSAESNQSDVGPSELVEWVNAVASQLEACAEELESDDEESLPHSSSLASLDSIREIVGEKTMNLKMEPSLTLPVHLAQHSSIKDEQDTVILELSKGVLPSRRSSDPDELLWNEVLKKESSSSRLSDSGSRLRSATSVGSLKNALSKSKSSKKEKSEALKPLLKTSHSHQFDMKTSLSATLMYLGIILAICILFTMIWVSVFRYFWPIVQ